MSAFGCCRPRPVVKRTFGDTAMMRETKAALRETGVQVFDIEIIWLRPETVVGDFVPFFEAGAELGAKAVLVGGEDSNQARMIASLAALCDLAAPFGLTINLELMPWTQAPNLDVATKVLHEVNRSNAGLLVDALHFHRSRSSVERLRDVPRRWFNYLQLCDAPPGFPDSVDALKQTAREGRLFPGEGVADLRGMLDATPQHLPISLEVPNKALAQIMPDLERVRRALDAARRIVEASASSE